MNRARWQQFISEMYGVSPEYPWAKYPDYAVFRHAGNRKWFALLMDVPKEKLGLSGKESVDVLNVKCEPLLIGSLRKAAGFFSRLSYEQGNLDQHRLGWHGER